MSMVRSVLVKSFVNPFYKANAGFFLVTLGLFFGFLKVPQHIDIAMALASQPLYYLIPLAIYLLYMVKVRQFSQATRKQESSRFLPYLVLLPMAGRRQLVLWVQALLLAPILGYSILLAVVAVQIGRWDSMTIVLSGIILLWVSSAHWLHGVLIKPVDSYQAGSRRHWTKKLPKTLSTLYIHELLNRQVTLLLGTKLSSLIVLSGFIMIYDMEQTDTRLLSLGILLSAGINSVFSFHLQRFEQSFVLFRNLPVSTRTWFWQYMLGFLLLALPELLVFLINNTGHVSPLYLLECCLFFVVLQSLYHAVAYLQSLDMAHFVKYPFFGTAILFFVILGYVPLYALALTFLLAAHEIFRWKYRRFTYIIKP